MGGGGRHYTDADGNFIPRQRPRTDLLPPLREDPLFPGGAALVDELPTLTDIYQTTGGTVIGSPALGRKLTLPFELKRTGRLDALDCVSRNAPIVIGTAYNNRLLLGGSPASPTPRPAASTPSGIQRRKT